MTDLTLRALREEYQRLAAAIGADPAPGERAEVRQAIVALFRRTEAALGEMAAFRESIRVLVDRFKALPEPVAVGPPSIRHDHIGASTFIERGWTALAGGDWHQAELLLRDALALDGQSADAEALLGWALLHQDRHDEALQRCLRVLVREPEQGLARTAVGAICLRKGITGEAIEHLSRVVQHGGDARALLYARYWLGVAYLEREMLTDAIEVLEGAVRHGPNLAEGWAELGRALWLRGDATRARTAWHTGAAVRHSPFASRAAHLLAAADGGGVIPRSPLD
jgi:tetratricopeptide (TPR) repeat protein